MLSIFPSLLSWQLASPLIIRLTLASVLIFWSYRSFAKHKKEEPNINKKAVRLIESLSGLLLIVGLWTQLVALVIIIDLIIRLYNKYKDGALFTDGVNYYIILLVLAISLLLTGPGFIAFDLSL
jgi:uncharacterized membrane protein YphA (DoxX/SURF4 family)